MNYDIKLYVHGVPGGHSSWGIENFDANYIDSFYGRKSNVPAQMFIEVHQFGSETYCYYTYFIGNTIDNSGRAGGYLGLTLRINYYYADVQNMYNLLDAAYNKFIVGSIVAVSGSTIKYLTADFTPKSSLLNSLEEELKKYLMQFSIDADFIPLTGFKVNGKNVISAINILECEANIIANHVKNNSSISVSPSFQSSREQQIIQKMTADINAANSNALQQIRCAEQNALRDVDAAKTKAQREVEAAVRDKEAGIQKIKNEYKEADKTISSLRKEIEKANKENGRLNDNINELNNKIKAAEGYERKYKDSQEQLEKTNALLDKVRKDLSDLNNITEILGISSATAKNDRKYEPKDKKISFKKIMHAIHPFVDLFVAIVLLIILGATLTKGCEGRKDSSLKEVSDIKMIEQHDTHTQANSYCTSDESTDSKEEKPKNFLKETYPKAQIDIDGFSKNNPMKVGERYVVSLRNVKEDLEGVWVSNPNDFVIETTIRPIHKGACSISYIVNNDTLVSRTIDNVKAK